MNSQQTLTPTRQARRLFVIAVIAFASAGGLAALLIHLSPALSGNRLSRFPPAFLVSTGLLGLGSGALVRAIHHVRVERQRAFRRSLLTALVAGTLFVGVQSWGLWWMMQQQDLSQAQTGASAFVLVFAALHALHFTVAMLLLVWITLRALADRYDHEYYWGVTLCAYLWHALGMVWLVILAALVLAVATQGG